MWRHRRRVIACFSDQCLGRSARELKSLSSINAFSHRLGPARPRSELSVPPHPVERAQGGIGAPVAKTPVRLNSGRRAFGRKRHTPDIASG